MIQLRSERFEMRLEPSVLDGIDEWRKKEPDVPSRAEAVRRLIEVGLEATRNTQPKISDGEKLLIFMLGQVAKKLDATDEMDPAFIESVIYGGHYWGLKWKYSGIFHGHMDRDALVREVVEILDMWDILESGFSRLPKAEKSKLCDDFSISSGKLSFPGFDGNHEAEHGNIMQFLVEKLGRFQSYKDRADLNSHMQHLSSYRRMLDAFRPIRHTLIGGDLTFSHFVKILTARRHPSTESS